MNQIVLIRPFLVLIALLALVPLTGSSIAQQSATVGSEGEPSNITIPPPTPKELSFRRDMRAFALEIPEARKAMIGGPMKNTFTFAAPGLKVAIIDSGFAGLREWLEANPKEKPKTHYVTDPKFESVQTSSHGYKVFRVARTVLSQAELYLYNVESRSGIIRAIDDAGKKGIPIVNIGLGFPNVFEINESSSSRGLFDRIDAILRRYQMFAFFSAGNGRDNAHSWISADRDNDGYVDFLHGPLKKGQKRNALRVELPAKASVRFFATWDAQRYSDGDYRLEVSTLQGRLLVAGGISNKGKRGFIELPFAPERDTLAVVRLKRLSGPKEGVFLRFQIDDGFGAIQDFNGLQTASTFLYRESPFLIHVGGVGKSGNGKLVPSAFSDIGQANNGLLLPHVLGPGQLLVDGTKLNGTSYASPFLTAIYSTAMGYNIKNVIERSSSHDALDRSVGKHEKSRWGVPEGWKVFFSLKEIVGETRITNLRHAFDGEDLIVRFNATRCCMEGMTWNIGLGVVDIRSGVMKKYPGTSQSIGKWTSITSKGQGFENQPVEVRVPMKGLVNSLRGSGVKVGLQFWSQVPAWRSIQKPTKLRNVPIHTVTF